jgi:hypothetical protein
MKGSSVAGRRLPVAGAGLNARRISLGLSRGPVIKCKYNLNAEEFNIHSSAGREEVKSQKPRTNLSVSKTAEDAEAALILRCRLMPFADRDQNFQVLLKKISPRYSAPTRRGLCGGIPLRLCNLPGISR